MIDTQVEKGDIEAIQDYEEPFKCIDLVVYKLELQYMERLAQGWQPEFPKQESKIIKLEDIPQEELKEIIENLNKQDNENSRRNQKRIRIY